MAWEMTRLANMNIWTALRRFYSNGMHRSPTTRETERNERKTKRENTRLSLLFSACLLFVHGLPKGTNRCRSCVRFHECCLLSAVKGNHHRISDKDKRLVKKQKERKQLKTMIDTQRTLNVIATEIELTSVLILSNLSLWVKRTKLIC